MTGDKQHEPKTEDKT